MKSASLLLCLCYMTAFNLAAQNAPPQQEGSVFSLEVGNLSFKVDSTYGAKVSSLTIDDYEFLVTSDLVSSDFLWGSTLWPSPQSEWNWNNENKYIWDNQEYTASIDGDTMSFTGKNASVDNGDSFHFIKNYWANSADTILTMHYSMVNITGKTIKKALWELTRVPVGGLTFWPTGPGGTWGQLAPATEEINDHTWYKRESEDGTNLKFFADGLDGWFAHVDDYNRLFIKTFEDVVMADFAPGEGEIELWVADEYIELENQSACDYITNQAKLEYEVKWYLRQLPGHIEATAGNMELVDYVKWVISGKGVPPVSITQNTENLTAHIYPNPATNTIHLDLNGSGNETYQYILVNIQGKVVKQGELTSKTIDLSELSHGMYYIQITAGKESVGSKFVIE